jgi:hypothetical protein
MTRDDEAVEAERMGLARAETADLLEEAMVVAAELTEKMCSPIQFRSLPFVDGTSEIDSVCGGHVTSPGKKSMVQCIPLVYELSSCHRLRRCILPSSCCI